MVYHGEFNGHHGLRMILFHTIVLWMRGMYGGFLKCGVLPKLYGLFHGKSEKNMDNN